LFYFVFLAYPGLSPLQVQGSAYSATQSGVTQPVSWLTEAFGCDLGTIFLFD